MTPKIKLSLLAAFSLTILNLFSPFTSFSHPSLSGSIIEDVRFEGLGEISEADLRTVIYVKPGEAYSVANLRKSIKYIYLKGYFAQVYADISEGKRGTILTFHVEPMEWISAIDIKGNRKIYDRHILPLLPLKEKDEFKGDLTPATEDKIIKLYEKKGYFNTSVSTKVEKEGTAVRLVISITEGRPCLLTGVVFKGDTRLDSKRLFKAMRSRIGRPVNPILLEKDRKYLSDLYHKSGYLEVEVSEPRITFDVRREKATVYFEIVPGPMVDVSFRGNRHYSGDKLLTGLDHREGQTVTPDLIKRWEEKTAETYREAGYSMAGAEAVMETKNGRKSVIITINEGRRYFFGKIIFKGNMRIKSRALAKMMTSHRRFFKRLFSESVLDEDIEKIRQAYLKRGVLDVEIEREITLKKEKGRVDVTVSIKEGPQTVVKSIDFAGAILFGKNELLAAGGIKEGEPLIMQHMKNASIRIAEAYSKRGYIHAAVTKREEFSPDKTGVAVKFSIEEGPTVSRGKVVLRGNRFTKDHVILRELTLKEGDPYDPKRILEDRQRIYRLGLFRGVKYTPINTQRKEAVKDMLLKVDEKKAGAVEFGAGYATEIGIRGFLETSYMNLGGTARSIKIRGEASGIEQKVILGYKEPWLMGREIDGRVNLVNQTTDKDSYELKKNSLILAIDKEVTDFTRLSLQYEIESSRYFNVKSETSQEEGSSTIVTLGPVLIRDSRDDPFNTSSGSVNILRYELADNSIASDKEFQKVTAQSGGYYPVTAGSVGALSLRLGHIGLLGSTQNVPIDRRFFLGGRTTVRGYREDSVGPKNPSGYPIGGENMLNINAEIRTKIAGNFGTLLFGDGGYVWRAGEDVKFSDIRKSFGAGIRYITPIGPLSFEYGHKIGRLPGESTGEWYFTIGNIF